jgi:DNA repair protein RecO (recombination protein O)
MIQNLTGIVLQKRPFTEHDLIVNLLTSNGERLELVAKGAAGPQSKRRAHLELMNEVQLVVRKSPRHLYLQSVECVNSFNGLKNKLECVFHAQALLEIIRKSVAEENPEPELYQLLKETLEALNEKTTHPLTVEISLLKLAHHLGVLPSFKHCGKCLRALEENAVWNSELGTVHCLECQETDAEKLELKYLKALEFFRQAHETEYRRVHLAPEEESVLRSFIRRYFERQFQDSMKILEWA